jgi:hypothetical protein
MKIGSISGHGAIHSAESSVQRKFVIPSTGGWVTSKVSIPVSSQLRATRKEIHASSMAKSSELNSYIRSAASSSTTRKTHQTGRSSPLGEDPAGDGPSWSGSAWVGEGLGDIMPGSLSPDIAPTQ